MHVAEYRGGNIVIRKQLDLNDTLKSTSILLLNILRLLLPNTRLLKVHNFNLVELAKR